MTKILIGAPVRQDHTTFYRYLKALNQLDTEGYEVDFFFILHNSPRLKRFLRSDQYIEYQNDIEYKRDEVSHHWTNDNLRDVTIMKNYLLDKALSYDYFFLVDSDIILQPQTLKHLINQNKPVIAECFWTEWNPDQEEMPNAWASDFYSFPSDNYWREWKYKKDIYQVGMTGACILIHRSVYQKEFIDYTPIYNVSHSLWEDRAFCIRCAVHGIPIYLSTYYPPQHLYRQTKPNKPTSNKRKPPHEIKS